MSVNSQTYELLERDPTTVAGLDLRGIPGESGFLACRDGTIWTLYRGYGPPRTRDLWELTDTPRLIVIRRFGRPSVLLWTKRWMVAHAVITTFVGPRPDGKECLHYDDDPTNNALSNLRWGSPGDNGRDRVRNGRVGGRVLMQVALVDVQNMREMRRGGRSHESIATELGYTEWTVREKTPEVDAEISAEVARTAGLARRMIEEHPELAPQIEQLLKSRL